MTKRRAEQWIFAAAESLEGHGLLREFCREIGHPAPATLPVLVETVWPSLRRRYRRLDGDFDLERARREMTGLSFDRVGRDGRSII